MALSQQLAQTGHARRTRGHPGKNQTCTQERGYASQDPGGPDQSGRGQRCALMPARGLGPRLGPRMGRRPYREGLCGGPIDRVFNLGAVQDHSPHRAVGRSLHAHASGHPDFTHSRRKRFLSHLHPGEDKYACPVERVCVSTGVVRVRGCVSAGAVAMWRKSNVNMGTIVTHNAMRVQANTTLQEKTLKIAHKQGNHTHEHTWTRTQKQPHAHGRPQRLGLRQTHSRTHTYTQPRGSPHHTD